MKDLKPFLTEGLVGILLIGASFLVKSDYYTNMVFSMGFGILAAAAAQMIRTVYWKNPKRKEALDAKKREARINSVDERKQLLRMKAGHITYQIDTLLLLLLAFLLALLRAEAWIVAMVFLLFIFQWVFGVIVYRMLEKRM